MERLRRVANIHSCLFPHAALFPTQCPHLFGPQTLHFIADIERPYTSAMHEVPECETVGIVDGNFLGLNDSSITLFPGSTCLNV